MDPAPQLAQRLREYALALKSAGQSDQRSLEEWLSYWNDDDTAYGNLRDIEHWLSQAQRKRN